MGDKLHFESEDGNFNGKWPNDIRLQVLDAPDAEASLTDRAAVPATGPAILEAVPLPWSIADPADDDVSESRSLPAINRVDHTTWRPVSHDCNTWLQGDGSLESLERLTAVKTEVAPAGDCAARVGGGSGTSGSDWQEFCRICHDGGERAPLIVACRCTGSMQHVHNDCLIHWILSSFNTHCEICLHRYRIGTTGMRLPHHWKMPTTDGVERYHMMLCMVAIVVLTAVITFLVYVSTDEGLEARTYRNSPLAPALYAVYAVLGLVCAGLASAELHYTICPLVERFKLTNMELLVVPFNPDDPEDDSDAFEELTTEYDYIGV